MTPETRSAPTRERQRTEIAKITNHTTTQSIARPTVLAVVSLGVARHLDRDGFFREGGRLAVWSALAGIPDGTAVRIDLGRSRCHSPELVRLVAEFCSNACEVEVAGEDVQVVNDTRRALIAAFAAGVAPW